MPVAGQLALDDVAALPALTPLPGRTRRRELSDGAWLDHLPGWLTGSDSLLSVLLGDIGWRADRRRMYDRDVDVPRLLRWYGPGARPPHPLVTDARLALDRHYRSELPEGFASLGLCLYRDGRDSVAWHGDRLGRGRSADTLVAILSLGAARSLALRPVGGGRSLRIPLGHGDLLVMGGSCQRTWEHAVPKTSRSVGPRVSIQFRPPGVA